MKNEGGVTLTRLPYWKQREIVKKYWDMRRKRRYYVKIGSKDEWFQITENQRLLMTYLYFYGKATYSQLADILYAIGRVKSKKRVISSMQRNGLVDYDGLNYVLTEKGRKAFEYVVESNDWMTYGYVKKEIDMILDRDIESLVELAVT